jgi:hypothetical protein
MTQLETINEIITVLKRVRDVSIPYQLEPELREYLSQINSLLESLPDVFLSNEVSVSDLEAMIFQLQQQVNDQMGAGSGYPPAQEFSGYIIPDEFTGIFPASVTGESSGSYAWAEQKVDNTTGAFSALTGGRTGTTSVNPAKEFNATTGLYGTASFYVPMYEYQSADGTKFYRFDKDAIVPDGNADGQILYWDNTDECWEVSQAPLANSIPYWDSVDKIYKFIAPAQYKVITSVDGTWWQAGYVRSH